MTPLLRALRWRQVGWTMLIVSLILLLFSSVVYLISAESAQRQVDSNLADLATQAAPTLAGFATGGTFPGPQGYRGGIFYLVLNADGTVASNPQQVSLDPSLLPIAPALPNQPPPDARAGPPGPRGGPPNAFATVTVNGEALRVVIRSIPNNQTLVVGESLRPEQTSLHNLLLALAASGGVALLLALVGAWFLAGRALVPIQRAFVRQQEFVADASHELRTPLTILHSATDLLNQERALPLDANGQLFDDVRTEIERMERLVNDLLTLARSDRGELRLYLAPLNLVAVSRGIVRRMGPAADARGVHLSFEAEEPSAGRVLVEADPDRLQQVLFILLDNALKHTPAAGLVTVRVRRQGTRALMDVIDTGSGIAPEHLPRIFDRFYRADGARSGAGRGTGLGLAIARTLVDAHKGELTVSSAPGQGTHVMVALPLAESAPPEPDEGAVPVPSATQAQSGSG